MSLNDVTSSKRRLVEDSDGKVIPVVAIADHNGDGDPALNWGLTQFGELVNAQRFNIIALTSVFGTSALRDVETTASGGTITASDSVIVLTSGTTSGGSATLASAERAPYVPGSLQEGGLGVRVPSSTVPTGDQDIRWGVWDTSDGIYFGYDASGPYVGYAASDTDTLIRQANWNVDKLDGTGPSGLTLNLDDGHVFRCRYAWYGYGSLVWAIGLPDAGDYSRPVPIHRVKVDGDLAIDNPNLPVTIRVDNGTVANNSLVAQVGGRNVTRIGPQELVSQRLTAGRNLSFSTTASQVPYVSIRRKAAFANEASVRLSSVQILTTNDLLWEIYLNPTLTTPSWVNPTGATAAETSLEMDISATSMSGGVLIASGLAAAGSANKSAQETAELPRLDFPGTQHFTLALTNLSGTGTASVLLEAREGW